MAPPKIKVRGAARAKGIPAGYILGRVSPGNGDVELIQPVDFQRLGIQPAAAPGLLASIPTHTILANPTAEAAQPVPTVISDILDFISSTRGAVLYRGASGWAALAVGTDGQVLTTHGAGADPTWANSSGGSAHVPLVDGAEPPNLISSGDGQLILVDYQP